MPRVVGGSQRGQPLSVQTHRVVVVELKLHIRWDLEHTIQLVRAGEEGKRKEGGRKEGRKEGGKEGGRREDG